MPKRLHIVWLLVSTVLFINSTLNAQCRLFTYNPFLNNGKGGLDCIGASATIDTGYPGAGVPNSTGSAWGTSYTVGTGANNLVQLNGSSQLPAVSAALLTNFPTLNQNTTGTAAGLSAQYIDWNAASGGNSIANKPTLIDGSASLTTANAIPVVASAGTLGQSDVSLASGIFSRAGTLGLSATGANVLTFSTNGSERGRFGDDGTILLGTTAAASSVDGIGALLFASAPNSNYGHVATFRSDSVGRSLRMISANMNNGTNTGQSLAFSVPNSGVPTLQGTTSGTSGSSSIAIAPSGGNVLIGTTTDDGSSRLQVTGNIATSGTITAAGFSGPLTGTASGNQPTDADLTAIAALACAENEIIKRNGSSTWICASDLNTATFNLFDPVTGDSGRVQIQLPVAATVTRVSCSVKAATSVTINLDKRAEATPDTTGTSILSAGLVCDTNSQTSCTSGCDVNTITAGSITARQLVALTISAVSGTPDTLRVHVEYTK